ncbi:MAG: ABC transporter permease, partial [Longimicrobiaceae bacterium]
WPAGARERVRGLLFRERAEAEMDEEMRFHLEMEAERLVREAGLDPREARRRAAVAFGGVERYREEVRDARGLAWVSGLSLDFRLGGRMLARYPGLTLVGGLAIAFAIAVGAATFEVVTQLAHPSLPLDEGGRVVGIRVWDAAANRAERRLLHDFAAWRGELRTVEQLGAFRQVERNLATGDGLTEPVAVAEVSASAFRVARVAPLLGRALTDADERPGAPPVVVVGHREWRRRFGGDPGAVGSTVRLGGVPSTVVGVMPEGFAFPVSHGIWVPLRASALDHPRGGGPRIQLFGRLAPGATLGEARAELAALGRRAAADFPATHRHLRPEVLPYAESIFPFRVGWAERAGMYSVNLALLMFLVLVCANVAALLFARTATRDGEIVVRTALGASRGRIVMQLFTEALVLGGVAVVLGLAAAGIGLRWGLGVLESVSGPLPFWFHAGLSPATLLYAGVLTVVGAGIAGALPALKVTRGLQGRLREAGVGSPGTGFGRLWTGVIVTQVAFTVAFLPIALSAEADVVAARSVRADFAAEEFLSARLELDGESPPGVPADTSRAARLARHRAVLAALERRLAAEPGVAGVTFADLLPRMDHPQRRVEVDGAAAVPADSARGHRVSSASVDADYFEVLGAPPLAGRSFHAGDLEPGRGVVVVNRSFVDRVLGGRSPIGRRVRYPLPADEGDAPADAEPGPWLEIVGVVADLGMTMGDAGEGAGIYHPVAPGAAAPVHLAVHVSGGTESLGTRLRGLAASVDPEIRVYDVLPLDRIQRDLMATYGFWLRVALLACGVVLLLATAGIYSILSFTVSRRTREIGIRVALGADRRRIVRAIFSRSLAQVGLGILAGVVLVVALAGGVHSTRMAVLLAAGPTLMAAAGMLASIVPTRRALRIEPTEALRAEV